MRKVKALLFKGEAFDLCQKIACDGCAQNRYYPPVANNAHFAILRHAEGKREIAALLGHWSRPNENKISHRWRKRAWRREKRLESWES